MKMKQGLEKTYAIYRKFVLFLLLAGGIASYAAGSELPDSLLTEDKVYEYTFSDFGKASEIMQQLRLRKSLPEFKLDKVEGDLYANTRKYYHALKFYHRALESDSVRGNDRLYMEQVHRLITCYDGLHNDVKKTYYVDILLKKAEQCGDEAMQSVALFNMGKMIYYQGNKEKGYELMQRAVGLMEQSGYKYKFDNLRYNYNTLLVFYVYDGRPEEALETLEALENVVTKQTGTEIRMEGLDEKEQKALYAHYAIVLSRLGRSEEARDYYRRFLALGDVYPRDNYMIMPYLFDLKMYDEVIRINTAGEKELIAEGDTVNYHMTSIKRSLGKAYFGKGDYRTAACYFDALGVLRDSIKNRQQKSAALELAALYETNQKDMLIQQQAADMRMRNALLIFGVCVVGLLGMLLGRTVRYNRKIRRKNEAMVTTIESLLGYKEDLWLKREENRRLKEQLQVAAAGDRAGSEIGPAGLAEGAVVVAFSNDAEVSGGPRHGDTFEFSADTAPSGRGAVDACSGKKPRQTTISPAPGDTYDSALFERLEHEIIKNKLFLHPDFSREELIKTIYIPKNKFASLFKHYAGRSFPHYINHLRLEHAAKMLKEYPDYTIDTIAKSCGMSTVQTFHRLFLDKFGVTPAEFRAGLKRPENEDDASYR